MRIALVGRGRLGRTLAPLLAAAGHAVATAGRGEPVPPADVVWLCVPDAEVARTAAALPAGPVVLHASGALSHEVLRPHRPAGSLHPLMTFPGPEVAVPDLRGVPAAVAGDDRARDLAADIAASLGLVPLEIPGDRRLYHAAAVLGGNFVTVLLREAARVLEAAGVDRARAADALVPLAIASIRNAARDPANALTGPVARGDEATLDAHRHALREAGLTETLAAYDALVPVARRHRRPTGGG